MDFSLDLFPLAYPDRQSGADYFRQSLDLCEMADQAGFKRVKVIEHYFHPYGGYTPSPATFLAAISQRTKQVRLVTGAVIPAFNHPFEASWRAGHGGLHEQRPAGRGVRPRLPAP